MSAITLRREPCALCDECPGTRTYALIERSARHDVALCDDCARSLAWRADDPLLVGADGTTYAGRGVRAIWRRLVERRPVRRRADESEPTI